jgi:hypothetical protein
MRIITPELLNTALCSNCDKVFSEHADGKCLFEPTEFKAYVCPACDWYIFKPTDWHTNMGYSSSGKKVMFHTDCIRIEYNKSLMNFDDFSHGAIMTYLIDVRYKGE